METFRYLPGVSTLAYVEERCVGCGACETVCPHGVFAMNGKKVRLVDKDGCMECGACALNCPTEAIRVTRGWDARPTSSPAGSTARKTPVAGEKADAVEMVLQETAGTRTA